MQLTAFLPPRTLGLCVDQKHKLQEGHEIKDLTKRKQETHAEVCLLSSSMTEPCRLFAPENARARLPTLTRPFAFARRPETRCSVELNVMEQHRVFYPDMADRDDVPWSLQPQTQAATPIRDTLPPPGYMHAISHVRWISSIPLPYALRNVC